MSLEQEQKLKMLQTYFNLMTMNGGAYVFQIASKMQILRPFASGQALSAEEAATQLQLLGGPLSLVLESLTALGILELDGKKFKLSPVAMLLSGNYENLSSDYWEHLPVLLKTGQPYKKMDAVEDSEKEYQVQVKSLEWMMLPSAKMAAGILLQKFGMQSANIIDFGAGSGVWSFQMLGLDPTAKATLVDWAAVLKVARDSADAAHISDRVQFVESNYHEYEVPKENFDLAILGNVTHIENEQGNLDLFQKAYNGLKPGGRIVIYDVFSEDPKGALSQSLYKIGLAIRTVEGRVHPPADLNQWLTQVGFSNPTFMNLDITPYTMGMIIAQK